MENPINNLEKYIEHTLLKPDITDEMLVKLYDEAIQNRFLGVCINPKYVKHAKNYLKNTDIKVVTVIGFPLGANTFEVKAYEAQVAVEDGADELDMVIDIAAIKNKEYIQAENGIKVVVGEAGGKPVKVILETDLLTRDEIAEACNICVKAGANFVKTSTGFTKGGVGATVENIKLMHEIVAPHGLQVKASGGVRDRETALKMIEAGAVRIGTSSGVEIVSRQEIPAPINEVEY